VQNKRTRLKSSTETEGLIAYPAYLQGVELPVAYFALLTKPERHSICTITIMTHLADNRIGPLRVVNDGKMHWTTADLTTFERFSAHFVVVEEPDKLGEGSDGCVRAYKHRHTAHVIAVKHSHKSKKYYDSLILREATNLEKVGLHNNIAFMLALCADFISPTTVGPAIILQLCDLGDITNYAIRWQEQQKRRGKSTRMHEVTVLKLFRDVSLALNHLHNELDTCYVHNDLKPANILALTPPGYEGDGIPIEPIFKVTDFARIAAYPTPPDAKPIEFRGTFEFAPPIVERGAPVRPSADIYSLGATIQAFALSLDKPVATKQTFIAMRKAQGKVYPQTKEEWNSYEWRARREVVARSLSATAKELVENWDVDPADAKDHTPYGGVLNGWYMQLLNPKPNIRPTSAQLKEYVVPILDNQIEIAKHEALAREVFEKVDRIRKEVEARRKGADDFTIESRKRVVNYGEGYGNGEAT